ncbi:MAG: S26 family signal peptidase, partial [Thermoguttaceae bacterium]
MAQRRLTIPERGIRLLIALLLLQTWAVDGILVPCQIDGGSMADTLRGTHRDVVCGDCGCRFACQRDPLDDEPRVACPNCGHVEKSVAGQIDLAGDRVLIDRSAYCFRAPRRWEIAAFRHPAYPGAILVKRVIGLPEESIEIRHGDIYVDGQIQRKTLAQQHALAVLVYDASYQPKLKPTPPPRWHGESAESRWQCRSGRFERSLANENPDGPPPVVLPVENEKIDWLVYEHWRRAGGTGGVVYTPVTDLCAYSPRPRREGDVQAVPDLLLSFRVMETYGRGELILWATDGREEFEVRIQPAAMHYEVLHGGRPVSGGRGRLPVSLAGTTVEISLFDQQFILALDGRTVVVWPYDRPLPPPTPPAQPLAIGCRHLGVVLQELRVYR